MRPLVILGDSVTTDHISPSGAISPGTPAADFLLAKGIEKRDFNNYTTPRKPRSPCRRQYPAAQPYRAQVWKVG
ncbi:hypothetical protein ACU4GD_22285 [Cupriavidus basilensis]